MHKTRLNATSETLDGSGASDMPYDLTLTLEVDIEPERVVSKKTVSTLAEATSEITDFVRTFGHPTKGRQVIGVVLISDKE